MPEFVHEQAPDDLGDVFHRRVQIRELRHVVVEVLVVQLIDDGIGDGDFSGYGVQLKVSVPLN